MKWVLALLAVAVIPTAALASIPDPENSITPDCIRICPGGDIALYVQVRDQNNNVIPFAPIRMIFSADADASLFWCPGQVHPVISVTADANGEYLWYDEATWEFPTDPPVPPSGQSAIYAGGCHIWEGVGVPPADDFGCVALEADPGAIVIDSYEDIGSPDCYPVGDPPTTPHGDGTVGLLDFVIFSQLFGSTHHCSDYNDDGTPPNDGVCDEDTDLLDFVVFSQHFDHTCPP